MNRLAAYVLPSLRIALASAAGIAMAGYCTPATAATATADTPPESIDAVQEIVVTAQRREQNVQDIPVAVTALTQEAIAINRVVTVNDLNLLAPGFTVEPAAGGSQLPAFSMRGITSYGVVPGSDKAISMYIDGVYLSSTRGSIFNLPDVSQIEVLRGPQGTLFGRNATAGAISITTRDPTGNFGIQQDFSTGNEHLFRSRTTVDLPAWGPFSAYGSYVRNYQRGDIENTGAGTVWDYSNAHSSLVSQTETSPRWLGTTDTNSFFAAVKFKPIDEFSTVYKFDYTKDDGSPIGIAYLGADAAGFATGIIAAQPTPVLQAGTQRPNEVNNAFSVPLNDEVLGHSLTSVYEGEHFTLKNIAAYRRSYIFAADQLDGLGGLVAPTTTLPFVLISADNLTQNRQWSDELQYIYRSDAVTLTVGGLWFQGRDINGGVPGIPENIAFAVLPGHVMPPGLAVFNNFADSIAGYTQAEVHLNSQFDIVGGVRETKDRKSGTAELLPALANPRFEYENSRPSYLLGVNYKPTNDMLVYVKYSTAFVSGGNVSGIPFQPETVASWEGGLKAEFLDHRLRTNIALYDAVYKHLQDAESGSSYVGPLLTQYPFVSQLGTFIADQGGDVKSHGVEFEGTLVVGHGLTVGSNVAYQHTDFNNVSPSVDNPTGIPPVPTLLPTWTVGLWSNYTTFFANGLKGTLLINANWRSDLVFDNPALNIPAYANYLSAPPTWVVNGRAVLGGFKWQGVDGEVAVWSKNLTNDRSMNYPIIIPGVVAATSYQNARTFGVDLNFKY
jgi:iron complex outermembrane receptor protein